MIFDNERRSGTNTSSFYISGGSAVTDDELRGQIRARLSEARLPAVNGCLELQPGNRPSLRRVPPCHRTDRGRAPSQRARGVLVRP